MSPLILPFSLRGEKGRSPVTSQFTKRLDQVLTGARCFLSQQHCPCPTPALGRSNITGGLPRFMVIMQFQVGPPSPLAGEGRGEGESKRHYSLQIRFIVDHVPPHPALLPPGEKGRSPVTSQFTKRLDQVPTGARCFLSQQH